MHSVDESAEKRSRADRRQRMLHRITLTAQRLTDERGLDGFTMDDLAEAVDVSRRTLFNYFPGKVDAVLGPDPRPRRRGLRDLRRRRPARRPRRGPRRALRATSSRPRASPARRWPRPPGHAGRARACWPPPTSGFGHGQRRARRPARRPRGRRSFDRPPRTLLVRRPRRHLRLRHGADAAESDDVAPDSLPRAGRRHHPRPARPLRRHLRHHPDPRPATHSWSHPMATLLYRLGKTAFRRWPLFLAGWLVAMLAVGTVAATHVQADDRRVLHPRHPLGEGRRPAGRALPEAQRRLRPGHASTSSSPHPRATRSTEPDVPEAVDALVADLATAAADAGRRPPLANPVDRPPAAGRAMVEAAVEAGTPRAEAEANAAALLAAVSEDGRVGLDHLRTSTSTPSPTSSPPPRTP